MKIKSSIIGARVINRPISFILNIKLQCVLDNTLLNFFNICYLITDIYGIKLTGMSKTTILDTWG